MALLSKARVVNLGCPLISPIKALDMNEIIAYLDRPIRSQAGHVTFERAASVQRGGEESKARTGPRGFNHFNDQLDHCCGSEELATLLSLRTSKIAQEIFYTIKP